MSDLMERRHFIAGLGWTGAASSPGLTVPPSLLAIADEVTE
jgi:hypothetical protein